MDRALSLWGDNLNSGRNRIHAGLLEYENMANSGHLNDCPSVIKVLHNSIYKQSFSIGRHALQISLAFLNMKFYRSMLFAWQTYAYAISVWSKVISRFDASSKDNVDYVNPYVSIGTPKIYAWISEFLLG